MRDQHVRCARYCQRDSGCAIKLQSRLSAAQEGNGRRPLAHLGFRVAPQPFLGGFAHRFWRTAPHPSHKRSIEPEVLSALGLEEPTDVLGIAIGRGDRGGGIDTIAVPIKISHHYRFLVDERMP